MYSANVTSKEYDRCLGLQSWDEVSYWFQVRMVKGV